LDNVEITVGYRSRLYPTNAQAHRLSAWLAACRASWNYLLALQESYARETLAASLKTAENPRIVPGKASRRTVSVDGVTTPRFVGISYADGKKRIYGKILPSGKGASAEKKKALGVPMLQPALQAWKQKPDNEWIADVPAQSHNQVAYDLETACKNWFSLGRGYPRRKSLRSGNDISIYLHNQSTQFFRDHVKIAKLGYIRLSGGRQPQGKLMGGRISREGGKWFVSAQWQTNAPKPMAATGLACGVDRGLKTLAVCADTAGQVREFAALRFLRRAEKKLARAQRVLSRRRKGSKRHALTRKRVARIHGAIAARRSNLTHHVSHVLTKRYDTIQLETLSVTGMARGPHAKSIADAGMGNLAAQIVYKSAWRGRSVIHVPVNFASTQICHICGGRDDRMKNLSRRTYRCNACGHVADRDVNAAENIRDWQPETAAGTAAQAGTRPHGPADVERGVQDSSSALRRSVKRQRNLLRTGEHAGAIILADTARNSKRE
jgi:putative transposase